MEGFTKISNEALVTKALAEMEKDKPTTKWKQWGEEMRDCGPCCTQRGLWEEERSAQAGALPSSHQAKAKTNPVT